MFSRLGRWCFRNRGKVVLLCIGAMVAAGLLSNLIGTSFSTEFALPDVESRRGFEIIDEHFDGNDAAGEGGTIVFRAEQGVEDPAVVAVMVPFLDAVGELEGVSI